MSSYPPLECGSILYRAVLYDEWLSKDGRTIKWQAFKRREIDTDGISLSLTIDGATAELQPPFAGMMSLHVGRVRDCSDDQHKLDVMQNEPDHAIIDGLPYPFSELDPLIKDEMQGALTAICRRIAAQAARLLDQ